MNHQPFEEWLLKDKNLTSAEKRELDLHLRTCVHCTSLSATGLALRSANVIKPAPGFVIRFGHRLIAQRIAERRRRLWGMLVLILGGAGLLGWLAAPYVYAFISAPVEWIITGIGYFLFVITSLQALTQVMTVLARILPDFIPPYMWMVIVSALAGFGLLWTISIWRFSRAPQGVSA
ncbi:MAG: hypothetical protein Q7J80_16820 [Anaerolineales bacterium]|nr:hypothetical protein [Anaerolineales bacterium]